MEKRKAGSKEQIMREMQTIFSKNPRNLFSAKALSWYFEIPIRTARNYLYALEHNKLILKCTVGFGDDPKKHGVFYILNMINTDKNHSKGN